MKYILCFITCLLLFFNASGQIITTVPGTVARGHAVLPPSVSASCGIITTIAGGPVSGYSGDGGAATTAELYGPCGVAVDGSGNLYITDALNAVVRKVTPSGVITTIAGNGHSGYSGDGGPATAAELANPPYLTVDGSGNVYIADYHNGRVRKVTSAGIISTIAGGGTGGAGYGGPATAARIRPNSVALDTSGNLYIAEEDSNRILKVVPSGVVSVFAGNGTAGFRGDGGPATAAELSEPVGIAIGGSGNLYIADAENYRIRKVLPSGVITTIAGGGTIGLGDGGPATMAELSFPTGVAVDESGNVYIADAYQERIRIVASSGIISTIAGNGTGGYGGDGGAATAAEVHYPSGVAVDGGGNIYIADQYNNRIRKATYTSSPYAGIIAGTTTICVADTLSLTDTAFGGVWSISPTDIATISGTGVVTGVSTGTAIITYTVTNACGAASANYTVTVNPLPVAGTISGDTTVCMAATITLTDTAVGGMWSSAASGLATVSAAGVVTGVASGLLTISYTDSNSCGTAVSTYSITVTSLPIAGSIAGGHSVCLASAISLNDTAGGGVWRKSNTNASISLVGVVTGITVGVDTIFYIVTNNCGADSASDIISINPLPDAGAISGATSLCSSSSATLTETASTGSWSSSSSSIATINSAGVVTGVSPGIDTITYSVTNSCGTAITKYGIAINPLPVAGTISGAVSLCPATAVTLTDTASGGSWSSGSTSIATVSAAGTVTAIAAGSATISYTVTNGCGVASVTAGVAINPAPDAGTISGPTRVCTGGSITLTDTATGGTWGSSDTSVAALAAGGIVTGVAAGTASISYAVTNSCGTAVATYPITINAIPSAGIISGAASVCTGAAIALSESVTGGSWVSASPGIATINSAGTITGISPGTTIITYTVGNVCGSNFTTDTISVFPDYASPIAGPGNLCAGTTISLTDTVAGGTWLSGTPSIATVSGSGTVTGLRGGTVVISYSYINSCGPVYAVHSVNVNLTPGTVAISGPGQICAGDAVTLASSQPGTYWSAGNSNATVSALGLVTGITAGIDTISGTITNACGSSTGYFIDTIDGRLTFGALGTRDTICAGDTLNLAAPLPFGLWFASNGHVTVSETGKISALTPGIDTITYSTINACGSSVAVLIVRVNPSWVCALSTMQEIYTGNNLSVYPDPNDGEFTVDVRSSLGVTATITIYNLLGVKVLEAEFPANKATGLRLNVPPGVYYLSGDFAGERIVKKMVVE